MANSPLAAWVLLELRGEVSREAELALCCWSVLGSFSLSLSMPQSETSSEVAGLYPPPLLEVFKQ